MNILYSIQNISTLLRIVFLLMVLNIPVEGQTQYSGMLRENSIFTSAPEDVKNRKAFIREWWFYEQRAYPNDYIPKNAYADAMRQRDSLRLTNRTVNNITWNSIGPSPGHYFEYGNISSRILTGAYHPTDPNTIYIGAANGGVWKSTDSGTNWVPITDDQPSLSMGSIVIDPINPNTIYAGTGEATYSNVSYYGRGLLKSTDAGENWIHITNGLPASSYFSRLIIRPNHSNELLAALGNTNPQGGLFRSTDAGLTWFQLFIGKCNDVSFSITGDTAFAVNYDVISGAGEMLRSTDGGVTFSSYGTGLIVDRRTHFDYCRSNPAIMYAAVYPGVKVYKSTNYGFNWNLVGSGFDGGQGFYDLHIKVSPWNPDNVFLGTTDLYKSTNGGSTFTNITNGYSGGNVHVDHHNLFFHPTDQNTFIVTNDGGIWRTTNNGTSFENLNQNLTLTQFYRIAASPFDPDRILGGTQDNGTQQTFNTPNWSAVLGADGGEVCFNPFDPNFILCEAQNGLLVRTSDGGTNWWMALEGINMSEAVSWIAPIISHPNNSGEFYTSRQRVYKTIDNGENWVPISGNVAGSLNIRDLAISKSNPLIMYAESFIAVYRSTDGGITWTDITTGINSSVKTSLYVHPLNSDIVFFTCSGFGIDHVFKTTNGGINWMSIDGNLPDSPVNDILIYTEDAQNPNTYFVATDVGVFFTQNDGQTWTELVDGLPNTVVMHLDYSPLNKMLRAGTHGRGVYEAYINFSGTVDTLFTEQNSIELPGVYGSSVAWGDYDNDGDLDLLLTGSNFTSVAKIYRNDGNDLFTEQTSISLTGVNLSSVAWGDYDNDGDLDILLSGANSGEAITRIYRNNGDNTFTDFISLMGIFNGSVAWGDYDKDGDLDILLTGDTGNNLVSKVFINNGDNSFADLTSLTGVNSSSVAWGDFDNDTDLDFLLTGFNGSDVISKVYRNNGNNSFTDLISLAGVNASSVAWGDYDNDGDLDILLTGNSNAGPITKIYRNNSNNSFEEQTSISIIGVYICSVAWGDYDNDGDLDIILSGLNSGEGVTKIYRNNGNNTFTDFMSLTGVFSGSLAWCDYDNDGDLDILLTGHNGTIPITKIYKNNTSAPNTIPTAPANLSSSLNGNQVILNWNKSTDNETPQNGLHYNLAIGTTPGGVDVLSPMSDRSTGYMRITRLGNSQTNSWTIKNLPPGTYYWTVQAIDGNFAGSQFAQEHSFVVSATTFQLSVSVDNGWNMVSIPGLHPVNQNVNTWWSGKDPAAGVFKFNGGYNEVTTTTPGEGYWMKHLGVNTYNTGEEWPAEGIHLVAHNSIPVNAGWNLIGGYENSASVAGLTTTPPALIVPNSVFGWNDTYYNPTNLEAGYGYWVLTTGLGLINPPTLAKGTTSTRQDDRSQWGTITIADATGKHFTLYSVNEEVNLDHQQMPPLPPTGSFDVRYTSDRKAENLKEGNQSIEMRGMVYPVTVRVENTNINLQDETGMIVSVRLKSGEEITISNSQVNKLLVGEKIIPDIYALEQNYPNPFNPSTTIKFSVPEEIHVNLSIFNILGERVTTLKNEVLKPGFYSVSFEASSLASGIYFYSIHAGDFISTKKMLLIK